MTMREKIKGMSAAAGATLAAMPGSRIGQSVPLAEGSSGEALRRELAALDVIGPGDGLTIKGSAVACVLQSEYLDRMFG